MGVSRTRYYEWKKLADQYGLDALMPKGRRAPLMPNATPTWVVNDLLTMAVSAPTLGCRQYADRLGGRGYGVGKSTVQDILVRHGLGRRAQRVARAAAIALLAGGLITDAAKAPEPFGFCHYATDPGQLVAMDSFYIGNLKGVGKVYQLTAIDTATRWAFVMIVLGVPTGEITARFVHQVVRHYRRLGVTVRAVLTDNGRGVQGQRIPVRSPNYNAVCERFQGAALQDAGVSRFTGDAS